MKQPDGPFPSEKWVNWQGMVENALDSFSKASMKLQEHLENGSPGDVKDARQHLSACREAVWRRWERQPKE